MASSQFLFAVYSLSGNRMNTPSEVKITFAGAVSLSVKYRIMGSKTINPGKDMSNPFPKFNELTKKLDLGLADDPEQVADVAQSLAKETIRWDSREIHLKDEILLGVGYKRTKWLRAKTYLEIDSNVSITGGGIQIYSDNTAADTNAGYTDPFAGNYDSNLGAVVDPSGLYPTKDVLQSDGSTLKKNGTPLPLVWRVTSSVTDSILGLEQGATVGTVSYPFRIWVKGLISDYYKYDPANPNSAPESLTSSIKGLGEKFPAFIYMIDLRSSSNIQRALTLKGQAATTVNINNLQPNELRGALTDYSKIKHADFGIQIGENTWASTSGKSYVFFAADFFNAIGANSDSSGNPISGTERNYKANIVIEAFTE